MFKSDKRESRFRSGQERKPPEYEQKLIDIRRVARVVAGGRRFSFRVTIVIGNRKGEVGVGIGKADDTSLAIEKAFRNAKKNLIKIVLNERGSIPCETTGKFGSALVYIKPSSGGRGLVAGGVVRLICSLSGIKNISSKVLGKTGNKLNNAQATINAFKKLKFKKDATPSTSTNS